MDRTFEDAASFRQHLHPSENRLSLMVPHL